MIPVSEPLSHLPLNLFTHRVRAGFPSPADDYIEQPLDLNEHLIRHPAATYYARAQGDSMLQLGIYDGDLLVVDRSLEPSHGDVVIAALNGELTCKVLDKRYGRLLSGNDDFPPIACTGDNELVIEGVVIASIRYHRVCSG
ncbi:translesion error-prone DNA polymerase V autoproteolytic subunit [Gilvimarinus agarilyticus]|nr:MULTISPECIES: translesion error-prone DNA polymerase V autoproteolytic subunit [unclassified Gilvimarinus]MBU2887515.1 translesion error-prone DNA polymerase V autoproteolytic subunit [Gilvimarinus agarilyticus]MDO6572166.1 translesion error-prone DNA polymerase V autoproteolytic subunit [Gilvimarinus sp. 2_MG-2023]MDO6746730.1 translesion error-prone DNA polymerase V autoproteolytic subunit [Gilvimarinus sp. 1_MG-2023]